LRSVVERAHLARASRRVRLRPLAVAMCDGLAIAACERMTRHALFIALALPLTACSLVAGSSSKSPHNLADSYDNATEMPVSLQNMKHLGEKITAEITRIEEGTSAGEISSPGRDIVSARTSLINYYGYGQKGGSEDCEACKNHPSYGGLKDDYAKMDKRLRALEVRYDKCTYGYQMANGDILKPTYDWSADEWAGIRKKAKHGQPRCWLNDDPAHYYSSNG
jgi:hypothetical protein